MCGSAWRGGEERLSLQCRCVREGEGRRDINILTAKSHLMSPFLPAACTLTFDSTPPLIQQQPAP